MQAWVESLRGFEQERIGLAELHPDVFATTPRLDILHQVAVWQRNFKRIVSVLSSMAELPTGLSGL